MTERIRLNVGGQHLETMRSTLCIAGGMLRSMFGSAFKQGMTHCDEDGCVFIDRDGRLFAQLLNFLRTRDTASFSSADWKAMRNEIVYFTDIDVSRLDLHMLPHIEWKTFEKILHPFAEIVAREIPSMLNVFNQKTGLFSTDDSSAKFSICPHKLPDQLTNKDRKFIRSRESWNTDVDFAVVCSKGCINEYGFCIHANSDKSWHLTFNLSDHAFSESLGNQYCCERTDIVLRGDFLERVYRLNTMHWSNIHSLYECVEPDLNKEQWHYTAMEKALARMFGASGCTLALDTCTNSDDLLQLRVSPAERRLFHMVIDLRFESFGDATEFASAFTVDF